MNSKSFLIATVSGFVAMFLLSWFGHELLMPLFYDVHPMESLYLSEPSITGIALAYIVLALLMLYSCPKGVVAGSTLT